MSDVIWYDIYTVVNGAMDRTDHATTEEEEDRIVNGLLSDLRAYVVEAPTTEWELYVTPHWCRIADDDDAECVCVQYATDHTPAYSSAQDTEEER